ncbi:hypothetical protein [Pollutibacter soli]|uniref:hypothetical protein n=1 Tax=Pollutibacter soli TaxID=3034157 RepID=UPI0030134ABD
MKKSTLRNKVLKEIMEQSKYALFEVCMQETPRIEPVVVTADRAEGEKSIWCSCEELPLPSADVSNLPVVLKFINREKGNFIKIQGKATVNGITSASADDTQESSPSSVIQVEIHQVAWFDKNSGEVEFFAA